jgi:hypothetical protein
MPSKSDQDREVAVLGFEEVLQKCEASLMPAIEEHVTNEAFDSAKDGLDFLEVKNSLLLTYLIDLTYNVRERVLKKHNDENLRRLIETRTVLDKTRPLEKKMRYQIDKLLAATITSFAAGGTNEDPLTYRPDPTALDGGIDYSDDSDSDSDDGSQDGGDSDMDDLEAAKATLATARQRKDDDGVYRAPRLASMPYPMEDDGGVEKAKRKNQRLRQSELAQTLRSEYGDAPEQADVHGGSDYGNQREAARRMAEREAEKISIEEDNMIRLVTSRKEKKERKRVMREESSNLAAIADLGSLVRGVSSAFQQDSDDADSYDGGMANVGEGRHASGKRKRGTVDEASGRSQKRGRTREPKNSLQKALYGKTDKSAKKRR